jgi:hypothetical protein
VSAFSIKMIGLKTGKRSKEEKGRDVASIHQSSTELERFLEEHAERLFQQVLEIL